MCYNIQAIFLQDAGHHFMFYDLSYFISVGSDFKDLFNWQHFIDTLKNEVHIVESLPPAHAGVEPFTKTPISWSKVDIVN